MKKFSNIKLLLTAYLLVLFSCSLKSQEWIRVLGEGIDVSARYIIEDYDKGYLIVADATGYKYTYLIKIDINGYKLWDKYFGNGSYYNVPRNIEITPDSGYIIAGTMGKYGSYDAYLLKLNSCYEKEWCKVLYNPDHMDYARKVRPLPEGGFILITAYYAGIEAGERLHLHKFDENGDLLWQAPFISSDPLSINEEGRDLHVINENEYLITGDCYHPNPGQTNPVILRPLTVKFDSSGNQIWDVTYGVDSNFYGTTYESVLDSAGNSYGVGYHVKVTGGETPTLVKISANGEELYDADLLEGSYHVSQANTINWSSDTSFVLAASWKEFEQSPHLGFLLTDTIGNLIKQKEVFTTTHSIISTARTFDNKFVSVALHYDGNWDIYAYKLNDSLEYDTIYTATFEYDYRCPYPVAADTTELDCDFLVYQEEPVMPEISEEILIYPNPASTEVTIDVSPFSEKCTGYRQLEILDIWGRSWLRKSIPRNEEKLSINLAHYPAGMYLAIMRCGNQITIRNKFIININH